jgi:transposase InsO family protein
MDYMRVARIMAQDNLLCVRRLRFVLTTDSKYDLHV